MLLRISENKKTILQLAMPVIAGLSVQMILSLIDTAIIGRLPDAKYSLAALGIAFYATWAVISFFSSLSNGTQILVSRNFGSKNYEECGSVLNSSLVMAVTAGFIVSVLVVHFSSNIANLFAADKIVGSLAGSYLFYRFMGLPFFLASVSYRGFYFGIGKTKIFMIAGIAANAANIFLDYTLVFGAFGFKGMGLAGAGLGSAIATMIETSVYVVVSLMKGYRTKYALFKKFRFNLPTRQTGFNIAKIITKLSLPVSFQSIFTLTGLLLFISIVGLMGTAQQAASQIVLSAMFLSFMPSMGFGVAAQTLVGNKLGENNIKAAKMWGFETSKISTTYTLLLGLIFVLFPGFVVSILTTDSNIINIAVLILRIAGFAQIFFGIGFVLANGLLAAGESFFVMLTDVTINWFVFVPLAYLLGVVFKFGIVGVWTAMPFYTSLYALIIFLRFNSKVAMKKIIKY
ncbi:MAG TPA: MATE family efflux transporter [Ignavibacteriaceae bacterium]|nr:MATE family efflux transporter [Ignavibacteriaceae bacterium]